MAAGVYLYTDVKSALNTRIHGKETNLTADGSSITRYLINKAVRTVLGEIDLRSSKRKSALSPNMFDDVYDYTCPTDLKGLKVIDFPAQVKRGQNETYDLVTPEEFDRRKNVEKGIVAINNDDMVRKLRISQDVDDESLVVANLDSLTGDGGTWTLYGDGANLTVDLDNFIKASGSINWDISAAGGTTAGIYNSDIDTFDITDFVNGSVFVWVYITSTTYLTNFIIRIGSGASAYYSVTVTTNNEGNSFETGWNLLRFDLSGKSTTGTVDEDNCNYVVLFMTKNALKISETDYRFDYLVLKKGVIYNVEYYSKYLWQTTSTVAYKENSDADTDTLTLDTEELDLVVDRASMAATQFLSDYDDYKIVKQEYLENKAKYVLDYPSEAMTLTTTRYYLDSLEGKVRDTSNNDS